MTTFDRNLSGSRARETLAERKKLLPRPCAVHVRYTYRHYIGRAQRAPPMAIKSSKQESILKKIKENKINKHHKKRSRHPIQLLYEDFFEQSYVCLIKKKKARSTSNSAAL